MTDEELKLKKLRALMEEQLADDDLRIHPDNDMILAFQNALDELYEIIEETK